MLKSLKAMSFAQLDVNQVGNRTYFIKLKTKKQEKIVQWDNIRTAPQAEQGTITRKLNRQ